MSCTVAISVVVSIAARTATICSTQEVIPLGLGKPGFETPTGLFTVQYKHPDPLWDNPFTPQVERIRGVIPNWISLGRYEDTSSEFGFHEYFEGIGYYSSHGCLRATPVGSITLYDYLVPGDQVLIVSS